MESNTRWAIETFDLRNSDTITLQLVGNPEGLQLRDAQEIDRILEQAFGLIRSAVRDPNFIPDTAVELKFCRKGTKTHRVLAYITSTHDRIKKLMRGELHYQEINEFLGYENISTRGYGTLKGAMRTLTKMTGIQWDILNGFALALTHDGEFLKSQKDVTVTMSRINNINNRIKINSGGQSEIQTTRPSLFRVIRRIVTQVLPPSGS